MTKKFTLKKHDGPGRITKINNTTTPNTINLKKYHISPNQETPYNIEKEIAQANINQTIEKAKQDKNKEIGVIQGGKYINLKCECAKKLEEQGYNYLIIANSDELLLHPQDLIETIIKIRQTIKPTTYLIFPFAEPTFIPLLSYLGIDFFNKETGTYYATLNILMTPTKNYELNTYKIYKMTKEELEKYNKNTIDFVLREVRTHMENSSLRNLVEERASSNPQIASALRILDRKYQNYLQKYTQLY